MTDEKRNHLSDLRGASKLAIDATRGVTDLVEAMHDTIAGLAPIVGAPRKGRTRGITGLVYRSIRGVTGLVGAGIDAALGRLVPLLGQTSSPKEAEIVRAVLNGVLGDYLAATNNPLVIEMRLRRGGQPLTLDREALKAAIPDATGKIVVMVHGSSMCDLQWSRAGLDFGALLERDLGATAVYLNYNSGLHISTNGRGFSDLLERLVAEWPAPIESLNVVAHSMGGLVTRSACHAALNPLPTDPAAPATQAPYRWPTLLRKVILLGTPHHGAPLERGGNWIDAILGVSPYSAPFARLGKIRSAGVTDLRYGSILDEDWTGRDRFALGEDPRRPTPLPPGTDWYAIAASMDSHPAEGRRPKGDGLVHVDSALGQHGTADHTLAIPLARQWIAYGMGHLDLLYRPEVYEVISRWLGE